MPEKRWVFDTVSFSNFILADSVFILEKRYARRAIITSQIYDEILAGVLDYPKLGAIDTLIDKAVFQFETLTKEERKQYLELIPYLGKGEASCLALATKRAAIVVTDDRLARKQCLSLGVTLTGTIGILKAAVMEGQIPVEDADKILRKMIENGFYSPVRRIGDIL